MKYYLNNGELDYMPGYNVNSPLTTTEKILVKGIQENPLPPSTQPTLPGADWNKSKNIKKVNKLPMHKQLENFKKYHQNDSGQLRRGNKAKGSLPKTVEPLKKINLGNVEKPTYADWRDETPKYRKFLADSIANEMTNIRWDAAGGWIDKLGDKKTAPEALAEQQKISKTYDSIYTPEMQKQEMKKQTEKRKDAYDEKKYNIKQRLKNTRGPSDWEVITKHADTWQDKQDIREIVNKNYKSDPSSIAPEDRKWLDKENIEPVKIMDITPLATFEPHTPSVPDFKTFLKTMEPIPDPDLQKGIASVGHVENYKNAYDKTEAENKKGPKGVAYILGEDK